MLFYYDDYDFIRYKMAVLKSHFIFTFGANFSQFSDLMQIANICNEREWRSLRGRLHFQRKWNSQRFIHRKWLKLHLNFHSLLRHLSLDLSGENRITILKVCPKNCLAQLRSNIQIYIPSSCTYVIMGEMREGKNDCLKYFLEGHPSPCLLQKSFGRALWVFHHCMKCLWGKTLSELVVNTARGVTVYAKNGNSSIVKVVFHSGTTIHNA